MATVQVIEETATKARASISVTTVLYHNNEVSIYSWLAQYYAHSWFKNTSDTLIDFCKAELMCITIESEWLTCINKAGKITAQVRSN